MYVHDLWWGIPHKREKEWIHKWENAFTATILYTNILLSKGGIERDISDTTQLIAEVGKTDTSFTSLSLDYARLKSELEVGLQH